MLQGSKIPEFVTCVDAASLRVYAPLPFIFLCGGKLDVKSAVAPSFREAFTRVAPREPQILLAEEVNAFLPNADYRDILTVEADLAEIAELVVLFSESYGSVTELGAFAMVDEIARRLLVVIDDANYAEKSFIALGPLRFLQKKYGQPAVAVLDRADLGIPHIKDLSAMNANKFLARMNVAINDSRGRFNIHTTFNKDNPGHVVKLMVGLIQHYGALYIEELEIFVDHLRVALPIERLLHLLWCAEVAGWIGQERLGTHTYFAALRGKDAISYKFAAGVEKRDKQRWRAEIVEHWRVYDENRYIAIQRAISRA